mmetsp:Transcript_39880/g.118759  ORF Transcript_39880/g.118759 Transcript_39880/m.118759 type:complete len:211 (-) Transcript_39880:590-1222(-)
MISPTSSVKTRLFRKKGGIGEPSGLAPSTIASARPSAMAVFPTPGSPNRMGLFFERRPRICMMRATSRLRPITGSMCPARTAAFRSLQNSLSILRSLFVLVLVFGVSDSASPSSRFAADTFRALMSTLRCSSTKRADVSDESGVLRSEIRMCSGEMYDTPLRLTSLDAISNVRRTVRLKFIVSGDEDDGFFPPSASTAALAASLVIPEFK